MQQTLQQRCTNAIREAYNGRPVFLIVDELERESATKLLAEFARSIYEEPLEIIVENGRPQAFVCVATPYEGSSYISSYGQKQKAEYKPKVYRRRGGFRR